MEKLIVAHNGINHAAESQLPTVDRIIKENQSDILANLRASVANIEKIQKEELRRKNHHDEVIEKTKQTLVNDKEAFKKDFVQVEVQKINEWYDRKTQEIKSKYVPQPTPEKPTEPQPEQQTVIQEQPKNEEQSAVEQS
jgi:hypothetical protein